MDSIVFCSKCKGTGTVPVGEGTAPCNRCSGDGQVTIGSVDSSDLEDDIATILKRLKKIMEKLEVKD